MVRVRRSVDIQARPETVFDLVCDVARKARLDPNAKPLGVGQETPGPVGVGTVFYYRLVIEGKIAEYRSRCIAFEPGRLLVTESDTSPPFRVHISVDPLPAGARLTHEETFTLPALVVPLPRARGWLARPLRLLFGDRPYLAQGPEALAAEEADWEARLNRRLERWLASIKAHLEQERARLRA